MTELDMPTTPSVPWWGLASSVSGPVLLVTGWTAAARVQPTPFDPVSETVSALMAVGASDRWMMTAALLAVGVCYVVTGTALRPAGTAGRLILIAGAMAGMLVAAYPENPGGSTWHAVWAGLGFAGLAAWPLGAWRRGPSVPWGLRRPVCFAAVAVQLLFLAVFVTELLLGGGLTGLAERLVGLVQALDPLIVVLSCHISHPGRALGPRALHIHGGAT